MAGIAYFAAHRVSSRYRPLLYLDPFGMALATIAGAAKGLDAGAGPLVALVMGVITAAFGGILRDRLGQEPSIVLRKDIYVSASAAGAALFLVSLWAGLPREVAMLAGLCTAAGIRCAAIWFNWSLPVYRARPGRDVDDRGGVE